MSESLTMSPVSGVAERYAASFFELAVSENKLDDAERGIDAVSAVLDDSSEFGALVSSPVYSSDEQRSVLATLSERAALPTLVSNFLGVIASNRRLFALPQIIRSFRTKVSESRGEVTAYITVPRALSDAQTESVRSSLGSSLGKDVSLIVRVDSSLLGGMIVQVGSRQIDTSLRSRLSSIKLRLSEVE